MGWKALDTDRLKGYSLLVSTRTLVIADLHGNADALTDILRRTGVMDYEGGRVPGTHVVQLGDLANMAPTGIPFRGFYSEDERILKMAVDGWIDELLVGNHELYFTHNLNAGRWRGMAKGLYDLEPNTISYIQQLLYRGQFKAATAVGDTLITHAGVDEYFEHKLPADAYGAAEVLNDMLVDVTVNRKIIDVITSNEGIFWGRPSVDYGRPGDDEAEWKITDCTLSDRWPQMVGHTPVRNNPTKIRGHWFIDTGGYMETDTASAMIYENDEWRVA
jgi:hypothetical protein